MKHCFQKMMYESLCHYFAKNKEIRKIKLFSLLKAKIQKHTAIFLPHCREMMASVFLF